MIYGFLLIVGSSLRLLAKANVSEQRTEWGPCGFLWMSAVWSVKSSLHSEPPSKLHVLSTLHDTTLYELLQSADRSNLLRRSQTGEHVLLTIWKAVSHTCIEAFSDGQRSGARPC